MIVNINETTKNVLKAVYLHWLQLVMTLLLLVFVVYAFTSWIITRFNDEMHFACDSYWLCFTYILNYGLRNGGGIAESMNSFRAGGDLLYYYEWFSMNVGWFLIITVTFLNIVFGIIIDTFSELRDSQREKQNDLDNVCFVCGLTRSEFAVQNTEFDKHINDEHALWDYVYFLFYMEEKGSGELNGLESTAWDAFMRLKCDWLPIGKTKYLKEDESADQMNDICESVIDMKRWVKGFDKMIASKYNWKPIGFGKEDVVRKVSKAFVPQVAQD